MKRTSDRLATFLGKKLNQAATVLEKTQTRPPSSSSPSPTHTSPPQEGQPAYTTTTSSDQSWYDLNTTNPEKPTAYTPPSTATPPVSNISLASPFPPDSTSTYSNPLSSSFTPAPPPQPPLNHPPPSYNTSPIPPPPSPYTLPPTASAPHSTTPVTPIPPPPSPHTPIPPPPSPHTPLPPPSAHTSIPPPPHTPTPPPHFPKSAGVPVSSRAPSRPPRGATSFDAQANVASLPADLLHTIQNRSRQAIRVFPRLPFRVSRPLDPSNEADLELWRHQLRTSSSSAMVDNSTSASIVLPTFTLSFVSCGGTDMFSEVQWARLKFLLRALTGLCKSLCVVLPPPAHTRVLPSAVFPVLSLSTRDDVLSRESGKQFWPFLEEVAGSWGGGVVYAAESRGGSVAGSRRVVSYVLRKQLDVLECVKQVLRNVYFGAVDKHEGFEEEVMEIAKWAFRKGVCLGEDWRERVVRVSEGGDGILPQNWVFLDGSRTVEGEWKDLWDEDIRVGFVKQCLYVTTDRGAYYLINRVEGDKGIWMLIGVDGGKAAWSKIMSGPAVVGLNDIGAAGGGGWGGVERAVAGQVGVVRVFGVRECSFAEIYGMQSNSV